MKKTILALSLAALAGVVHAEDYEISGTSKGFYQFTRTSTGPGTGLLLDAINSDHYGNAWGAGLEQVFSFNDIVTIAPGVKFMRVAPTTGSGFSMLFGGRVQYNIQPNVGLFAKTYYGTEGTSSQIITLVRDTSFGVMWIPTEKFFLETGYRYYDVHEQVPGRNRNFAHGPFFGIGLHF